MKSDAVMSRIIVNADVVVRKRNNPDFNINGNKPVTEIVDEIKFDLHHILRTFSIRPASEVELIGNIHLDLTNATSPQQFSEVCERILAVMAPIQTEIGFQEAMNRSVFR